MKRVTVVAAVAGLALAAVPVSAAFAVPTDKQPMHSFATGEPLAGTFSALARTDDSVAARIRTAGQPGHALTTWYVVFNDPGACNGGVCGEDDIFVGGDPTQDFDFGQIEAARISVVFGGDGDIVNPGGRIALDGGLSVGEVPTGNAQIVIGDPADGALVPGPVTGLENARTAEVHVVLQNHGSAHADPSLLAAQLSGFQTACNPVCVDVQFAVHKP